MENKDLNLTVSHCLIQAYKTNIRVNAGGDDNIIKKVHDFIKQVQLSTFFIPETLPELLDKNSQDVDTLITFFNDLYINFKFRLALSNHIFIEDVIKTITNSFSMIVCRSRGEIGETMLLVHNTTIHKCLSSDEWVIALMLCCLYSEELEIT